LACVWTFMAASTKEVIGFVGCGTMSSAIVRGLCTTDAPPEIVLSPRNAEKAAALHGEFPQLVSIAASNQEVVDRADVVFIGVLPRMTEEVCCALNFEERHTVISLVSTAALTDLRTWLAPVPADRVSRAIPLPPVARHKGATLLTPPHPTAIALFDALGTSVPVDSEASMTKMLPVTALMGQFYAQQRATQAWLEAQGIAPAVAAEYVGAIFHSISYDSAVASEHTFNELVEEQTPGGVNEQVIRELTEGGAFAALTDSLDGVLARIEQRRPPAKRRRPYESTDA